MGTFLKTKTRVTFRETIQTNINGTEKVDPQAREGSERTPTNAKDRDPGPRQGVVCAGCTDLLAAPAARTPCQGRPALGKTYAFSGGLDTTCWVETWPQRQMVGDKVPPPKPLGDRGQVGAPPREGWLQALAHGSGPQGDLAL